MAISSDTTPATGNSLTSNRAATQAYLRWLADQPDGVKHREWLFSAALMLDRDTSITWIDKRGPAELVADQEKEEK